MRRTGILAAISMALGLVFGGTAWAVNDGGVFEEETFEDEGVFEQEEEIFEEEGVYGDDWQTDEYGIYDEDYEYQTDEGWFDDWFGESDEYFEGLF